jgi:UDP-N-acetylglucosamine 2-epimerase (non-hydrolysing)
MRIEVASSPSGAAVLEGMPVMCVLGTRPEAIKMAPVIGALRASGWARTILVSTGQHREMLRQTLSIFGLVPDVDLEIMAQDQSLAQSMARMLAGLDPVIAFHRPAVVVAQGDTSTVAAAAMTAFYRRVPFAHVEAGLRSGDIENPFPEEFNRVAVGRIASLHFAPTEAARANLLLEGVDPANVTVTGNTVIDALLDVSSRRDLPLPFAETGRRLVLATLHRRENHGVPLRDVCRALRRLHDALPDIEVVFPVHPNPAVRTAVALALGGLPRVRLLAPLPYDGLVSVLRRAVLVLTDSGGLQEEAPALGKPVLVCRLTTERPEAEAAGAARLVGTDADTVFAAAHRLLTDPDAYAAMARPMFPYGDGHAAARIVAALRERFDGAREAAVAPELGHLLGQDEARSAGVEAV